MKTTTAFSKIVALNKPLRVIQGGTSASKTYSILQILNFIAENTKHYRLISVVSDTTPNLKTGVITDFKNIRKADGTWDDANWNETDKFYRYPNAKIEFIAFDKETKARGARRDILFVNECNRLRFETVDQLMIRTKEFTLLDYNPTTEFWLHEEKILEKSSTDFLIVTYKDNEFLDPRIVAKIEEKKPVYDEDGNLVSGDEHWWRVYGEGKTGILEGTVFSNYEIIPNKPKRVRLVGYGLDFGFTNDPTALIGVWEKGGNLYLQELIYQTGLTNQDICKKFAGFQIGETDKIIADSAEPKSIEEIFRQNYNIHPAKKGADSIKFGIDLMRSRKIFITEDSANLIKEFKQYHWAKDKNGKNLNKPIDAFNHGIDAVRYVLITESLFVNENNNNGIESFAQKRKINALKQQLISKGVRI